MKAVVILCALVVVVTARPEEKYTSRYDNTDYKAVIRNEKLFMAHANCVLGKGKCTSEAKELASKIADALQTRCSKCTEKQQEAIRYVIKYLINEKPDIWKQVCEKYDPTGKYAAEYEKELKTL